MESKKKKKNSFLVIVHCCKLVAACVLRRTTNCRWWSACLSHRGQKLRKTCALSLPLRLCLFNVVLAGIDCCLVLCVTLFGIWASIGGHFSLLIGKTEEHRHYSVLTSSLPVGNSYINQCPRLLFVLVCCCCDVVISQLYIQGSFIVISYCSLAVHKWCL